jgi:hypothetical protein
METNSNNQLTISRQPADKAFMRHGAYLCSCIAQVVLQGLRPVAVSSHTSSSLMPRFDLYSVILLLLLLQEEEEEDEQQQLGHDEDDDDDEAMHDADEAGPHMGYAADDGEGAAGIAALRRITQLLSRGREVLQHGSVKCNEAAT